MRRIGVPQPDPMELLARLGRQLTDAQSAGALHCLLIDTTIRQISPRRMHIAAIGKRRKPNDYLLMTWSP